MQVREIFGIAAAIVGLAAFATAVSSKSNTSGVLGAAFGGFSQVIRAATSPVTG
ncbi:MAG: hypothetical protein KGO96_13890 [Elusimicrobia bacterium]|nr:hypothetical protein [Elusimicrobiota bacterium]MDE2426985.1 hypothetical protein [Elusimicrobiota bacterium]